MEYVRRQQDEERLLDYITTSFVFDVKGDKEEDTEVDEVPENKEEAEIDESQLEDDQYIAKVGATSSL